MAKGYRSGVTPRNVKTASSKEDTLIDIGDVKHHAEDFYEKHKLTILGVLGGLVLVIGGWLLYKFMYQEPKNLEALEQMYQAEFLFEKDSFDLALNNPGGGFAGFAEISENYSGTSAGNLAKYYAGMCCLNLQKYEEAKQYFEDFDASGKIMPILKNAALGDVSAELNDLEGALKYYQKATTVIENEFLTPVNLKKLGVLKQKLGDKEGALKAFKEIKTKYPDSPDGNGIDKFIIPLE
ncbi:MAG: tetratricopeptide repeat protein [Saprospiraceae bacterium]|nr:tetratricopeptide repeat protein [Saprospiraceae bacterium]MBK9221759.1 tetratricopeptide repeat protein [Saprospiraceae bacterium]MBK9721304.1 tetratricopeptide repeat protein [Saprospiraceae bacterium]